MPRHSAKQCWLQVSQSGVSLGGDVTTLFRSPRNARRSGGGDRRSLSGRLLARARRVKQQPADQRRKNNRTENEPIFAFQRAFGVWRLLIGTPLIGHVHALLMFEERRRGPAVPPLARAKCRGNQQVNVCYPSVGSTGGIEQ